MRVEADRRRAALKLSQLRAQQGQAESDGAVTRSEIDAMEHARRVDAEYHRQKARQDARRRLADEERGPQDSPKLLTLRERLARPQSPVQSRIDGWQPLGTRVILAAQHKSGKTIATQNLTRSLVDGDPWLDKYAVRPVEGTIAVLDFEMSDRSTHARRRVSPAESAARRSPTSGSGPQDSPKLLTLRERSLGLSRRSSLGSTVGNHSARILAAQHKSGKIATRISPAASSTATRGWTSIARRDCSARLRDERKLADQRITQHKVIVESFRRSTLSTPLPAPHGLSGSVRVPCRI